MPHWKAAEAQGADRADAAAVTARADDMVRVMSDMMDRSELLEQIRQKVALGHTAREIATMVGCGLTKNAVIGLCYRNDIRLLVGRSEGPKHRSGKPYFGYTPIPRGWR